ncbi:hypothetical protein EES44_14150 [Streptomyces sp. ADI96-15]|uniref:hypothetical protein n=2 Tax=Streptomyces TaxID=1883 RepID=UPI0003C2D7FA|nr:hypothetical protein [Streptomyces sp. GBA 94-10 4N24]ESP96089.1 hypothetical protein B591_28589 [Streptomyces sp. GBA 94-10 4N24]ESQ02009.1 hypothetical protein B590_28454 [Streptomyces sp. PVA_94-07]RPK65058.1 hypothetical protein EES44_14150 [Streptomyces sp. ADI96-15]UZN62718.1 hypothetical protein B591N_28589 [Streptomyces sp. GBA 94-10 4N24]
MKRPPFTRMQQDAGITHFAYVVLSPCRRRRSGPGLAGTGVTAEGFPAHVADAEALTGALRSAAARFGEF